MRGYAAGGARSDDGKVFFLALCTTIRVVYSAISTLNSFSMYRLVITVRTMWFSTERVNSDAVLCECDPPVYGCECVTGVFPI